MAEIRVQNLEKSFGAFKAVRGSTFTVEDGGFFCLLGPSGCGKTTTLRMVAGLELPTAGSITLGGEDVTFNRASSRDIAMVFQLFALYPHMSVRNNIAYPLKNIGTPRAEIRRKVEEAARILRITHLLDGPVGGLSGGDRQRVALGRAIVRQPKAFMMDEPLGALDSEFRHVMCGELRALHDRLRATTVYVTHDQMEAMSMADTIAVMNDGVMEQLGPPQQIYDRPATLFVADFIGQPPMNLLPVKGPILRTGGTVTLGEAEVPVPGLAADHPPGDYVLGIRPEHVRLSDAGALRGTVFGSDYLGTQQIVTVTTALGPVRVRLSAAQPVEEGSTVGLTCPADRITLFSGATGRALPRLDHEGAAVAEVELHGLSKRFGPIQAVDDLSLSVGDGEFVVLLGPTGVGKTTILRLVAGLEQADAGRVAIAGVDVTRAAPAARDVAFVFQQYSLYPHLTVFDNLAFPLRSPLRPMAEAQIRTRVETVATMLRISDKLGSAATRLSGGQMQRVAIGRALVRNPSVYLMDEPLSSLDAKLRADLRLELKHIQRDLGATMIYVTHDQIEAMTMADRIGVIEKGRLAQLGTPRQIYRDPTSAYVATRLGTPAINLLPCSRFPGLAAPPEATTFGVRPEHVAVRPDRAGAGVPGRITRVEPLGDQSHLHIDLDGTPIVTLVDPEVAMHEGDAVRVDLVDPLLFDADGRRVRMAQGAGR